MRVQLYVLQIFPRWWCLPEAPSTPMSLVPQRNLLLSTSHPLSTYGMFTSWRKRGSEVVANVAGFRHIRSALRVPVYADSSFLQASGTLCPRVFLDHWSQVDSCTGQTKKSQGLTARRNDRRTMIDWSWCRNTYFSYLLLCNKIPPNQWLKTTVMCYFS